MEGDHYFEVEAANDGRYRFRCSCGSGGRRVETEEEANSLGERHLRRKHSRRTESEAS